MRRASGWSGGCRESCCGEALGDFVVDDAQCVAERGRGLGLVARHERAQDAVVDFVTPWLLRSMAVLNIPPGWLLGFRPAGPLLNGLLACFGRPRSRVAALSASNN